MKRGPLYTVAVILTLVGALNWGVVGITGLFGEPFNPVEFLFFGLVDAPYVAHGIYAAIGIAAVVFAGLVKKQ